MQRIKAAYLFFGVSVGLLLGACGGPDAYIYDALEFNREDANFAKDKENIETVTICYNKIGTKPEIIAKMAKAECGRFNKKEKFIRQSFKVCPLFAPVAAIYDCIGDVTETNYFQNRR